MDKNYNDESHVAIRKEYGKPIFTSNNDSVAMLDYVYHLEETIIVLKTKRGEI